MLFYYKSLNNDFNVKDSQVLKMLVSFCNILFLLRRYQLVLHIYKFM